MKKKIISKLDKSTITLIDIDTYAYIGVENTTPNNPFTKGFLGCVNPGLYQMFFDGFGHINRTTGKPDTIENIVKKWQNDIDITFYHFDTATELYNWLANE